MLFDVDDLFIPEFCETATISGTSYSCIRSEFLAEEQFSDYGLQEGWDLTLDFKVSDFISVPAEQTIVVFNSRTYRIAKTITDSAGLTFKAFLIDQYGKYA